MKSRRGLIFAVLLLASAHALFAQSLAEAAKKEKERRAAFKNKTVRVITNDALSSLSKTSAISTSAGAAPDRPSGEAAEDATPGIDTAQPGQAQVTAVVRQSDQSAEAATTVDQGLPVSPGAGSSWERAKEYADLLELKLNSLWLQYYSLDDGMPRELLMQEISATFEKYTKAREEENKLRGGSGPPAKRRE